MAESEKQKKSLKNFRFNLYPKYLLEENCRYYSKMSVEGRHLVRRGKVTSEFEEGESREYLYYMEYLVRPVSLRDKNDTDVKHYLERVQELEEDGYELVCSGRGGSGVSIFRTEDGTLRAEPPKNTYHKCVRSSFGLFLSFLLWMMAITLLDWVWLGRDNFFGRFVSWVFMLELTEFVLGAFFLLRFLVSLVVLTLRYRRRDRRARIVGGAQVAERCVSTVLIAAFAVTCLLAACLEPGRDHRIEKLPEYAVRVEDIEAFAGRVEPPLYDKKNNTFNCKVTLTVAVCVKSREKRILSDKRENAVVIEQAIYEFRSSAMAKYAVEKYVEGERRVRGGKHSYSDITQEEVNPGFDELFDEGFRYQYCGRMGRRVVMFGLYFTSDTGAVPEGAEAYNDALLACVYRKISEA